MILLSLPSVIEVRFSNYLIELSYLSGWPLSSKASTIRLIAVFSASASTIRACATPSAVKIAACFSPSAFLIAASF